MCRLATPSRTSVLIVDCVSVCRGAEGLSEDVAPKLGKRGKLSVLGREAIDLYRLFKGSFRGVDIGVARLALASTGVAGSAS